MNRIRAARECACAALLIVCPALLGCGAASLDQDGADEPAMQCGPHARPRHRTVVATTTTSHGEVIDWIPIESQVGWAAGASAPSPPPAPQGHAAAGNPTTATNGKGPPGTVP